MRRLVAVFVLVFCATSVSKAQTDSAKVAIAAGEAAFARKDYEEALRQYRIAFEADSSFYEAALYAGDAYLQMKQTDSAVAWYDKAITINPARETAYRYASDAHLKAGRKLESRDMAISAMVAEPYHPLSRRGIQQWQLHYKVAIEFPEFVVPPRNKGGADSAIWSAYYKIKDLWAPDSNGMSAIFVAHYSRYNSRGERVLYRPNLTEEMEAFTAMLSLAREQGPSGVARVSVLAKLQDDNLLEAHILFRRANQWISEDYKAYLAVADNREKLVRYWTNLLPM